MMIITDDIGGGNDNDVLMSDIYPSSITEINATIVKP